MRDFVGRRTLVRSMGVGSRVRQRTAGADAAGVSGGSSAAMGLAGGTIWI